ncbi:hypothetical protein CCH79_00004747, partial [Gambusia affinis]
VDELVFCAGQIPLVPCTMSLVKAATSVEAQLSFSHVKKVLEAVIPNLTLAHVVQAHCYITRHRDIATIRAVWESMLKATEEEKLPAVPLLYTTSLLPCLPFGFHAYRPSNPPHAPGAWAQVGGKDWLGGRWGAEEKENKHKEKQVTPHQGRELMEQIQTGLLKFNLKLSAASAADWVMTSLRLELLWESEIKLAPLLIVVIPALPKDAAVELHVTAVNDDPSRRTTQHVTTKMVCGSIRCHTMLSADRRSASLSLSMIACGSDLGIADVKSITEELGTAFMKATKAIEAKLVPQCARVFYKCSPSPIQQIVQ